MMKTNDLLESQINAVKDKLKKQYRCDHILLVSGLGDTVIERFILKNVNKSKHLLVIEDKFFVRNVLINYQYNYDTICLNNDYNYYDFIFINIEDQNIIKEILNAVSHEKVILLNMEKLSDANISFNNLLLGIGFLVPFISFYTKQDLLIDDFDTNISLQYHSFLSFNKKENT